MPLARYAAVMVALYGCVPVQAGATATPALEETVRQQAEEIRLLRARLDALEARAAPVAQAANPPPAVTAPSPVQTAPAGADPFPNIVTPGPADLSLAQAKAANPAGLTTDWNSGAPLLRSADGRFTFKPRGRILMDASTTMGSGYADRNMTTTGGRALRMGIEGGAGPHLFYQFEVDYANNGVDLVTAFLGWRNRIAGTAMEYDVRVGHLFNDRSFEGGTRSDMTPFLDRNTVATSIIPQRAFYGVGIQPRLFGPNWHLSFTLTGDRVDGTQAASDSRTVMVRGHWNPFKTGRALIHLGAWMFDEHLSGTAGILTRNAAIGGRFNDALRISTGALTGGTGDTGYGLEAGGYSGPLWLMGEWGQRQARTRQGDTLDTRAMSISGGWFLTGELPPYNPRTGNMAQPKVRHSILDDGTGAIELVARYEQLSFDGLPTGGSGWAATVGTNWYLTNLVRVMFNLIHWHTDNRSGVFTGKDDGQTATARVSVSF